MIQNLSGKRQNIAHSKSNNEFGTDPSNKIPNDYNQKKKEFSGLLKTTEIKNSLYEMIRDTVFNFLKIKKIKNIYDRVELLTVNSINRKKRTILSILSQKFDIFINGEGGECWYINPKAKRNIMICHFPTPITNTKQNYVKYYEIYSDSNYSRKWVIRLWNVTPKGVLYPLVNFFQEPIPKKNYILYTARFIPIREQKKQSWIIKAFIKLYKTGITNYELHLIGSTSSYHSQNKYLKYLFKLAKGYPIYFHINVGHSILARFYQESKFFWNLVGINVNENEYPQDIEHFGLTTVESMQNYCVPLVYNKGGPRESVKKDNITGFLVDNIDSLIEKTRFLIENEPVRKKMAQNAFERGEEFSLKNFEIRLLSIINEAS